MLNINHSTIVVPNADHDRLLEFLIGAMGHMGLTAKGPNYWVWSLPQSSASEDSLRAALKMTHVAFAAQSQVPLKSDQEEVDRFHSAAIEAGGISNGAPGLRPYHAQYYAAFVLDPVCHINWEVVHHGSAG
ncbi:hypothetical protein LTR17_000918 [Elasticomyces elasticus]|nr:hypothetical protein LTR17_000918 [Elasticomyces elasticus]